MGHTHTVRPDGTIKSSLPHSMKKGIILQYTYAGKLVNGILLDKILIDGNTAYLVEQTEGDGIIHTIHPKEILVINP